MALQCRTATNTALVLILWLLLLQSLLEFSGLYLKWNPLPRPFELMRLAIVPTYSVNVIEFLLVL
jgi:hypothetical protein